MDEKETIAPAGDESCEPDDEEAIACAEARPFGLTPQDDQLLTKQRVLAEQLGPRAKGVESESGSKPDRGFRASLETAASAVEQSTTGKCEGAEECVEHASV